MFLEEKNDVVNFVLVYINTNDKDTEIKTLWHLCKSV